VLQAEPPVAALMANHGEVAAFGVEKGKPFAPDARVKASNRLIKQLDFRQTQIAGDFSAVKHCSRRSTVFA
jgi:hypothetical protein